MPRTDDQLWDALADLDGTDEDASIALVEEMAAAGSWGPDAGQMVFMKHATHGEVSDEFVDRMSKAARAS